MSARPDVLQQLADARPRRLDPTSVPPVVMDARPSAPARRPVLRRLVVAAVLPAVAAVVVAALVLPRHTDQGATPPGATASAAPSGSAGAPRSARDLLLVAADQTDASAAAEIGRYWVKVQQRGEPVDVGAYTITTRRSIERWLPTSPHDVGANVLQDLGAVPATPADETAWKAAGSPTRWTVTEPGGTTVHTAAAGPRRVSPLQRSVTFMLAGRRVTAADLAALPTDPAALRAVILQAFVAQSEAGTLFAGCVNLVADLPVSAGVRAAAYRVLADLPGVDLLGTVQDRQGRPGMAVAFTWPGDGTSQQRLIIDVATGRALAIESWHLSAGGDTLTSWTVQVRSAYTDEAPPAA